MSSTLAPPRPTEIANEPEAPLDPAALIEEARQRQRRRRRRLGLTAVALAVTVGLLAFGVVKLAAGGSARTADRTPPGMFVNRTGFAGQGLLAFVSRGQLFVLDGKRQELTTVTHAGAQAGAPAFSPEGKWLAYTVGSNAFGIAHADGTAAHVFPRQGSPLWLPNGELLVRNIIYRVAANGALRRARLAPAGLVAWSPSGDRFAFVSRIVVHGANGAFHGVERLQVADSLAGPRTTWRAAAFSFTRTSGFEGDVIASVRVLPGHGGILFSVDPDQSSSYAADGLSLYEQRSPSSPPVKLAVTVGDTVSVGKDGKLAIGAGGNRYAWVTKSVITCTTHCSTVPTPPGRLAIDPAWSPGGRTLAFVQAAGRPAADFRQATIASWYATHTLWLLRAGASQARELRGTRGASTPVWSKDGRSLLYVADDALWLVPSSGGKPEKIAGPLYPRSAWPSYYGQVDWSGEFAWAPPAS